MRRLAASSSLIVSVSSSTVVSAASFAKTFYESLFDSKNLGQAVLDARTSIFERFETNGDVTAFGLTFFGDSGTAKRADLATACR